jgi:transposase
MDYHHHARLVVYSREQLAKDVLEGRQSAAKWVRRYRDHGVAGLKDRSSRPHRSPRGTSKERIMEIEQLRRQRWTGVRIAQQLGLSRATVSRVLRRLKLNRIRHIEPQLPPHRYEHAAAGDLLHLDIKRLVRIQRPSHRVTGDRRDGVKGIGAEICTSPSTTTRGSPSPPCIRIRPSAVRRTSWPRRWPGTDNSAS